MTRQQFRRYCEYVQDTYPGRLSIFGPEDDKRYMLSTRYCKANLVWIEPFGVTRLDGNQSGRVEHHTGFDAIQMYEEAISSFHNAECNFLEQMGMEILL